jgi:hypothetical protein
MSKRRTTRIPSTLPRLVAFLAPFAGALARAQEEGTGEVGGGGGDPTFGYILYGALAGLILFMVCKSARRS